MQCQKSFTIKIPKHASKTRICFELIIKKWEESHTAVTFLSHAIGLAKSTCLCGLMSLFDCFLSCI